MLKPMHLIWFCFLFLGCDLFATREPESPDSGNQIVFIQPDRPEIVLENFSKSIEGLSIQNYLLCFNQTELEFVPSQRAALGNAGIWSVWGYQEEQTYLTNLVAEASLLAGHRIIFSNQRYEVISETKQQFIARYTLTINHNRANSGVPTTMIGDIILDLESANNGLWSIVKWTDVSSSDAFTWSELKAVFIRG